MGIIILKLMIILLAINAVTGQAFYHDKKASQQHGRRVPERTLLLLALLGGTPAAFWARQRYRHKTLKKPFSTRLWAILLFQVTTLAAVLLWHAL
jgi:uncharacterized membrane protein YsdA (DUF1294 family)